MIIIFFFIYIGYLRIGRIEENYSLQTFQRAISEIFVVDHCCEYIKWKSFRKHCSFMIITIIVITTIVIFFFYCEIIYLFMHASYNISDEHTLLYVNIMLDIL